MALRAVAAEISGSWDSEQAVKDLCTEQAAHSLLASCEAGDSSLSLPLPVLQDLQLGQGGAFPDVFSCICPSSLPGSAGGTALCRSLSKGCHPKHQLPGPLQVFGHPLAQRAEVFTLWEYLPHTWVLLLQVDLQRKVEERNRLLAEYKVMEPLPWGFG